MAAIARARPKRVALLSTPGACGSPDRSRRSETRPVRRSESRPPEGHRFYAAQRQASRWISFRAANGSLSEQRANSAETWYPRAQELTVHAVQSAPDRASPFGIAAHLPNRVRRQYRHRYVSLGSRDSRKTRTAMWAKTPHTGSQLKWLSSHAASGTEPFVSRSHKITLAS